MPEPRFLVVRLGSLGDIVHTFPAVAGLRESFPGAEIVWLTHPRWRDLVESSELATEIWETETRSYRSMREIIRRIRKRHFTIGIDYQGLWKSAALPFFGGVSRRIGFSSQTIREFGVPILYTDRVLITKTHIADRWPPDRFGSLCEKIKHTLGMRCVVNYGTGEEDLVSAIKAASGEASPIAYNGSLGQLMALLRNAACIVGGDTGPLHLAVALGTPAVAIFGPTDPTRNGPYRMGDRACSDSSIDIVLRSPQAVTTYKRGDQPAPSILEIDVDAVFDAVRRQVQVRR